MAKIPINKFDKFIKDKVDTHQTPIDTDRLWSNIQKTGISRRSGILPGTLLLLLISFFVSIHLLDDDKSTANAGNQNANPGMTSAVSTENTIAQSASNNITSSQEFSSKNKLGSVNPIGNTAIQSDTYISSKSKTAKKQIQKNLQQEREYPATLEYVENTESVSVPIVNDLSSKGNISPEQIIATDISSENLIGEPIVISNEEAENTAISMELGSLANLELAVLQTEVFFPEISFLPQHKYPVQHAKYKKGFGLRINAGAGKVIRKMELLNPEAAQWMQSRNKNEHQLEAVRLGLDLKFRITQNVYFFAGIEDFRINERFDYNSLVEFTYSKDGLAAREVHDENSYTVEEGRVDIYEAIHKRGTFYNQFRMINIPFGIGITQQFGRFGLGLEGAILVNAFHDFKGKIADAGNDLIELQNVGLKVSQIQSARINGNISFHFSPKWGVNLFTGVDLPLKSIQLGQHMSQNFLVFHGNLGICYNW